MSLSKLVENVPNDEDLPDGLTWDKITNRAFDISARASGLLLKVIAIVAIVNLSILLLYVSYPQELVAEFGSMPSDGVIMSLIMNFVWFFICKWYTAKSHVREYLGQVF
jgi:hypothetical protein